MEEIILALLDTCLIRERDPRQFPISEDTMYRYNMPEQLCDTIVSIGKYVEPQTEADRYREAAIGKTYIVDIYQLYNTIISHGI